MQSSQPLQATSTVLLSTSRCSRTPLELSKVLSESARAFSGCYEIWLIGWSNLGAPKTSAQICGRHRVKLKQLRSSGLGKTSRAAETAAQLSGRLGAIFSQQWFVHYHKAFHLCYSHKVRYIIIWHALFKSCYIYTYSQSGRKWWSSIIWGAPGHAHWENLQMHHLEAVVVKQWS